MVAGGRAAPGRSSTASPAAPLSPADLVTGIETYLADHPAAAVLEEGRAIFDMRSARFSVTELHGRCLLQLWSEERNLIRTVVGMQARTGCLRLTTRRMGAPRPESLELVPTPDRRTPTARDTARRRYLRLLERVLSHRFPGAKVDGMRSAMDLEHSFGPAYTRGRLLQGTVADAVIGIGASESTATIDGVLTLGLLWLDYCRKHADARRHFGGLKVIVPAGAARTTAERMACLSHAAADFQLFTLDERSEELAPVDFRDTGNFESHLVQAFSPYAAIDSCRPGIDRVLSLVPEPARVELYPRSPNEVALLLHGLEFARVRRVTSAHSFAQQHDVTFGAGAHETPLNEETESLARELFARLFLSRRPDGLHADPLFRLQPERWLESRLRTALPELLPRLRGDRIYSQVPALSSSERGMLDLLALDRDGRLAVIELKANEDLHLPLQALDYWIRVRALNADRRADTAGRMHSAFERAGYFPAAEVSSLAPRLLLAGPALRIHPANEPLLRYLSPEIDWELIALSEHWRSELKVVFRKRAIDRGSFPPIGQ